MRKLLGLMSRCSSQQRWQCASDSRICCMYDFTSAAEKMSERSFITSSRSVSQYSNTCAAVRRANHLFCYLCTHDQV